VIGAANFDNNNYPQNAFAAAETASGGVFVAGFRPGQPDSGRTITLTTGQSDVSVRNDL
jgi:hypothetical protein